MNLLDVAQAEIIRLQEENEDLRFQLAQMRRDLGFEESERIAGVLAKGFYLSPQEAWLLGALYSVKEMRSKVWLLDNMPGYDPLEARDPNLVPVIICRLRKHMGQDSVRTFWGRGYGLTAEGRDAVDEALALASTFTSPTYRAWMPNGSRNRVSMSAIDKERITS